MFNISAEAQISHNIQTAFFLPKRTQLYMDQRLLLGPNLILKISENLTTLMFISLRWIKDIIHLWQWIYVNSELNQFPADIGWSGDQNKYDGCLCLFTLFKLRSTNKCFSYLDVAFEQRTFSKSPISCRFLFYTMFKLYLLKQNTLIGWCPFQFYVKRRWERKSVHKRKWII